MNDPNGFCYFAGAYHVFFQYSPHDALGRTKYWGHYRSKNLTDWEYLGIAIRSDCPWGVERERFRFWNVHQSGYFLLDDREKEKLGGTCKKEQFHEFDFGYDFYAPQTMLDTKGRRLLFGWAEMSEMEPEFDNEPTIAEGWQHSLTLPRELTYCNGIVYQYLVEEINVNHGEYVYTARYYPKNVVTTNISITNSADARFFFNEKNRDRELY